MRILKAPKNMDPTDPDPQHWYFSLGSGVGADSAGHPGQVHHGREWGADPVRVPGWGQCRLPQGMFPFNFLVLSLFGLLGKIDLLRLR